MDSTNPGIAGRELASGSVSGPPTLELLTDPPAYRIVLWVCVGLVCLATSLVLAAHRRRLRAVAEQHVGVVPESTSHSNRPGALNSDCLSLSGCVAWAYPLRIVSKGDAPNSQK